ncbi:MAG: phosphoadenylyl-sulfate reductase [Actinomycetota bacterium]
MKTLLSPDLVTEMNDRFETETPQEIIRWAIEDSGLSEIAIASSFQAEDTVVMDMAARVRQDVPILFLETGFHFAETLAFKERLIERLGLNVVDLVGDYTVEEQAKEFGDRLWERDPKMCCELNKVIPLNRALNQLDSWVTGMRRDSAPTRANAPIVDQYELEPGKTLVKFNPIANWTRKDAWDYLKQEDLPHLSLYDLGYASIGCAPCTRIVWPGEDERAGRWAGAGKVECGIHTTETAKEALVANKG